MKNEKKKKTIILTIVAVVALLLVIIGATYAYFAAVLSTGANEDVTVQTHTSNTLTYNISKAISVTADDTNLVQNGTDRSDSATGTVTYKSGAEQSSACYTMDLTVDSNNFVYTTNNNTLELVLNVIKNGTSVITNADITTGTSTVHIPTALNGSTYKQTITANASQTVNDTWVVTVTFKNLATDQSDITTANNAEKTFEGEIVYTTVDCTTGNPINNNNSNSETAYYWNDDFSGSEYFYLEFPETTYSSLAQLRTEYANFASKPYYIKTSEKENQACLYYNNHEFCLSHNYWDTNASTTLTNLQTAMEDAFETSADECLNQDNNVECHFDEFYCWANYFGDIQCGNINSDQCYITNEEDSPARCGD